MTAPISYSYTVTAPDMAEAMLLAGAGAGGAMWRKGAAILVSILYGVMMVLGGGGLPMNLLEKRVDQWIESQKG